jgi:hypothetical protein
MMAAEALSRQQKPSRAATEAQETRKALAWAKDKLRQEGRLEENPKLSDLIWRLLQDAAEQESRLSDKHRVWLHSSDRVCWPELARPSEDNRAIEQQIQNEIEILRTRTSDGWNPVIVASHPNEQRMHTVLAWFGAIQSRWKSRHRWERDKFAMLWLARGVSVKTVREKFMRNQTDRSVYMVRDKVIAHIADKVWRYWK